MYLTWDVLNPILYSLGLALLISWLFARVLPVGSALRPLNLLPFSGGLADLLENLSIVLLLAMHPTQPAAIAWLATCFTMLKMSLLALSALLVPPGLVAAALNRFNVR
jgi:hypothetical protein